MTVRNKVKEEELRVGYLSIDKYMYRSMCVSTNIRTSSTSILDSNSACWRTKKKKEKKRKEKSNVQFRN